MIAVHHKVHVVTQIIVNLYQRVNQIFVKVNQIVPIVVYVMENQQSVQHHRRKLIKQDVTKELRYEERAEWWSIVQ